MQINRLFEIIMILLNKETVTAKELASHFDVSTRTIYRDIDTLSVSNIPIYTNKGNGGGISILPEFTLDKSVLSEKDQCEIIGALQSLKATKYSDVDSILTKLGGMFKNSNNDNWVEVDFSHWGSNSEEKSKFTSIKSSILMHNVVEFDYVNLNGDKTKRIVYPLKLVFKGQAWYLQGFCETKKDNRIFKISRISHFTVKEEKFEPTSSMELSKVQETMYVNETVHVKLKFDSSVTYRIYDDFGYENVKQKEDDTLEVSASLPKGEWLYGYILSFGPFVEVLEPEEIREKIKNTLKSTLKIYNF